MLVDLKDGCCRSCQSQLEVIDADDASMTVECTSRECGDVYRVESDAFNDGAIVYYVGFLTGREIRTDE